MANTPLRNCLLETLAYYDVFSYPLTQKEFVAKVSCRANPLEVAQELDLLIANGLIFRIGEFFSLRNDPSLEKRRQQGNQLAHSLIAVAKTKATFIGRFPFVQGIFISGSLSKNYADSKSDLDFFVITAPGRLWVARSVFILYRKFFILRKNFKHYCLNYFVAEDHLTIEEQNLFTATELATLIPVYGNYHQRLMDANRWLLKWLPNQPMDMPQHPLEKKPFVKKFFEKVLNLFGSHLDSLLMRLTLKKFKWKHTEKFSKQDFAIAFKSTKQVSKSHEGHNQKRVMALYEERIRSLRHRYQPAEL
ncbi:MAG: hypothetical protein ACKOE6_08280 [Flammeovirgaceae bacterium]